MDEDPFPPIKSYSFNLVTRPRLLMRPFGPSPRPKLREYEYHLIQYPALCRDLQDISLRYIRPKLPRVGVKDDGRDLGRYDRWEDSEMQERKRRCGKAGKEGG